MQLQIKQILFMPLQKLLISQIMGKLICISVTLFLK